MEEHAYRRHNKTLLLYHIVCPVKYRRKVITEKIKRELKIICEGIQERYEIAFIEIGIDEDHVHFLVQSIPTISVSELVKKIKGITSREIFIRHAELKGMLWGGNFWTSGYYANTVGQYANADVIREYVQNQGRKYEEIHKGMIQLELF